MNWSLILMTILIGLHSSIYGVVTCTVSKSVLEEVSKSSIQRFHISSVFGLTAVAFEEEDGLIQVIFESFNGTFVDQPKFTIGYGQLLDLSQTITLLVVYYRDTISNEVIGRVMSLDTFDISSSFQVFSASESSSSFGTFTSSILGFIAWGSSEGFYKVIKQDQQFSTNPNFIPVLFDTNTTRLGAIRGSAMDENGIVLFVIQQPQQQYVSSLYNVQIRDSIFTTSKVTFRGQIPIKSQAIVRSVASSSSSNFMIITSNLNSNNNQENLQMLLTTNLGLNWQESLEVGSFLPKPFSSLLVTATWMDRWVIFLDYHDSFGYITIDAASPFEFDWRNALPKRKTLFVNDTQNRTFDFINRGSSLVLIGMVESNIVDFEVSDLVVETCRFAVDSSSFTLKNGQFNIVLMLFFSLFVIIM